MPTVKERIEADDLLFDSAIVQHGYAPYLRDYEVAVDVPASKSNGTGESYIKGRFVYRFTHCPEVYATTTVSDEAWQLSWGDEFTDYEAWERAGAPEGYVWGVRFADADPGFSYVDGSPRAAEWSERLAHEMHEVVIETNAFTLRLVFHDFAVEKIGAGDPTSGDLRP